MPSATFEDLCARLREILADLEQLLQQLSVPPTRGEAAAVERWLQLAIQICVDLGDRILAAKGEEEPPRQRDVFAVLGRLGVLDPGQVRGMERLVNVRNTLVHDYLRYTAEATVAEARQSLPTLLSAAQSLIGASSD